MFCLGSEKFCELQMDGCAHSTRRSSLPALTPTLTHAGQHPNHLKPPKNRVLIEIARATSAQCVGFELNPALVRQVSQSVMSVPQ